MSSTTPFERIRGEVSPERRRRIDALKQSLEVEHAEVPEGFAQPSPPLRLAAIEVTDDGDSLGVDETRSWTPHS